MIFVDSNIWCYYFDKRLPEHEQVREPLREIIQSEQIMCNTIIVMEVAQYIVRHFVEDAARKKIDHFINLRNMTIADFNRVTMAEAIDTLMEHAYSTGLGGRDATILATMTAQNIRKVISHDDVFKRLANELMMEVIDAISKP
jgi:predicted nucleic acid-binding protein